MPFALIRNEQIHQIFPDDPMLLAGLEVISVGDDAKVGWVRKGKSFSAPPPIEFTAAPAAPVITYKADLYRRCTDAEAEAIETALVGLSVRQRRLFEESQFLDHTDEAFLTLQEALIGMFGKSRTAVLLAAS